MVLRRKPKGSARLPKWWMQVTPHKVSDSDGMFPKLRSTAGGDRIRVGNYDSAAATKKIADDASLPGDLNASAHSAVSANTAKTTPAVFAAPAPAPAPAAVGGPVVGGPVVGGPVVGGPVVGAPAPAAVGGPVLGAPVVGAPAPAAVGGPVVGAPAPAPMADPSAEFTVEEEAYDEEEVVEEYDDEEVVEEVYDEESYMEVEDETPEQTLARKKAELEALNS